jgi:hypothetical protein
MEASTIQRAHFTLDGWTVEVEPCPEIAGTWRGRVVAPDACWSWHTGYRAWGAVEAAVAAARRRAAEPR